MTQADDRISAFLTGELPYVLLLAAVLALPVSLGLLSLYRRAVLRSMRAHADAWTSQNTGLVASRPTNRHTQTARDLPGFDHTSYGTSAPTAAILYSDLLRAPWRVAAIYAVAGGGYALAMAAAALMSFRTEFLPLRFLVFFLVYAWPVVLTVCLVAAATRRAKLAIGFVYFLGYAVLGAIAVATSPTASWIQIVGLWLLTNLPVTVLLWVFLNRRIRAVGPLVLTFMVLALTGSNIALAIPGRDETLLRSIVTVGVGLGLGGVGIFIGLILLGFAVFGPIGWVILRWIGRRYERKKISDQSITLDAIWLLSGIFQSIMLVPGGVVYFLSGFLAFALYKMIAWAGLRLLDREAGSDRKSYKLLLLRVFSLGRRSERLFDTLAKYWRHVGDIRLIAGPDLATTTVEPHEFLGFLSGKLARRYVDGPETLGLRISEMDLEPDRDGRFRVNDFFCYEDTWQMTLSRLVGNSDAVLMDLRGFSRENRGVVYEIAELINLVPLGRVVFVVDETTDEHFLRQSVQESWDRMNPTSPNRSSTPDRLHLFRFTGSHGGEFRRFLHALSSAASSGTFGDKNKVAPV